MNTPELVIAVTDTVDAGGDVVEVLAPTFKQMAEQRAHMAKPVEGQPAPSKSTVILSNAGTLAMGIMENHEVVIPKVQKVISGLKATWKAIKDPALPDSWDKKRNRPDRCGTPESTPTPAPTPAPLPPLPTPPIADPVEKEPEPEKE